jgi:hypothetical protein
LSTFPVLTHGGGLQRRLPGVRLNGKAFGGGSSLPEPYTVHVMVHLRL